MPLFEVTNDKIAGLAPRWASFHGFSLLFDNPDPSLSPLAEGVVKMDCDVKMNPGLGLYRRLEKALAEIGHDMLLGTYLLCPLPPDSYHVTVWDGINDGNVDRVTTGRRARAEAFLRGLPEAVLAQQDCTRMVLDSPLVSGAGWSMRFKFDRLCCWRTALVARLAPADEEAAHEFEHIVSDRRDLSHRFHEAFGVSPSFDYAPHVTLCYLVDLAGPRPDDAQIASWTEQVEKTVAGQTVTFDSLALYGFTDMVTFFKRI